MKKVVINNSFESISLSSEAVYLLLNMGFPVESTPLAEIKLSKGTFTKQGPSGFRVSPEHPGLLLKDGLVYWFGMSRTGPGAVLRSHPALVSVVEQLGRRAGGGRCVFAIETIEDDAQYRITEYDNAEGVVVYSPEDFVTGYVTKPVKLPAKALSDWSATPASRV